MEVSTFFTRLLQAPKPAPREAPDDLVAFDDAWRGVKVGTGPLAGQNRFGAAAGRAARGLHSEELRGAGVGGHKVVYVVGDTRQCTQLVRNAR